jgi:branched-chain amino acid transport system permease protein
MLGGMEIPGCGRGRNSYWTAESFGAGYISSTYKDAFAFIVILGGSGCTSSGLFGRRAVERV